MGVAGGRGGALGSSARRSRGVQSKEVAPAKRSMQEQRDSSESSFQVGADPNGDWGEYSKRSSSTDRAFGNTTTLLRSFSKELGIVRSVTAAPLGTAERKPVVA